MIVEGEHLLDTLMPCSDELRHRDGEERPEPLRSFGSARVHERRIVVLEHVDDARELVLEVLPVDGDHPRTSGVTDQDVDYTLDSAPGGHDHPEVGPVVDSHADLRRVDRERLEVVVLLEGRVSDEREVGESQVVAREREDEPDTILEVEVALNRPLVDRAPDGVGDTSVVCGLQISGDEAELRWKLLHPKIFFDD